jgi:hypothetical protein
MGQGPFRDPRKLLADQQAKTAARVTDKTTSYNRIPLSTLFRELEEESKLTWQQNWEESPKAAQTKVFFQSITDSKRKYTLTVTASPTYNHGSIANHIIAWSVTSG